MNFFDRVEKAVGLEGIFSVAELSPQAVAVSNDSSIVDVYFRLGAYHLIKPKLWKVGEENLAFPEDLRTLELGTLPGMIFGGKICGDFSEALKYAREHLVPVHKDDRFFNNPRVVYEDFSHCA